MVDSYTSAVPPMPSMCRVVPFIPINFVEFIVIHIVAFLVSSTFNFFVLF